MTSEYRLLLYALPNLNNIVSSIGGSNISSPLDLQTWKRIENPQEPGAAPSQLFGLALDRLDDKEPRTLSIHDPNILSDFSRLGTIGFTRRWNEMLFSSIENEHRALSDRLKIVGSGNAEADLLRARLTEVEGWLALVSEWFIRNGFTLPQLRRGGSAPTDLPADPAHGGPVPVLPDGEDRLTSFRDEYLAYVETNHAPKTLENAKRVFKVFMDQVGDMRLVDIELQDVEKFKQARKGNVGDSTINIDVRTLKAAFALAVDWGKLPENPFARAKNVRVSQKVEPHMTDDRVAQLLSSIKEDWFKRLVHFAVLTGLRRGEVLNLTPKDFDKATGVLTIQSSDTHRVKGGKARKIPLQPEAIAIISAAPAGAKWLFPDSKGDRIVESLATKKFKKCVEVAGLPKELHFHSLRHTFATMASNSGMTPNVVKAVMGHASMKTTEGYIGTDTGTIREQMKKVSASGGTSGAPVADGVVEKGLAPAE